MGRIVRQVMLLVQQERGGNFFFSLVIKYTAMTAPQNKEIVQQLFKEGICKKNLNLLDQLIHPQYVNHGIPDAQPGPDGFKEIIQTFHEAFPDMDITIDNIIAEGDFVAIRGCWQATHQGQFMGVPATGSSVRVRYTDFWRVVDGQCIGKGNFCHSAPPPPFAFIPSAKNQIF